MYGIIKLKDPQDSDVQDLFEWRNHQIVRKNSFNVSPISWQEHVNWYKLKKKDPNVTIYIAYYKRSKIGVIRFEDKDDVIKVSITLNPVFIGRGMGKKVIRCATEKFVADKKPNKPIIAEIKKGNVASSKSFQMAGFKEKHSVFVYSK